MLRMKLAFTNCFIKPNKENLSCRSVKYISITFYEMKKNSTVTFKSVLSTENAKNYKYMTSMETECKVLNDVVF